MLAYITVEAPFGTGEAFLVTEMSELQRAQIPFRVIPRSPPMEVFHEDATRIVQHSFRLPLFGSGILLSLFKSLFRPKVWKLWFSVVKRSRSFGIAAKNATVIPKAIHLSDVLNRWNVTHIHAHWGSTTATMAYVTSRLTGIPFSITLHRWDIAENNMLQEKANHSKFMRCISNDGLEEVLSLTEGVHDKIHLIHMGVRIPEIDTPTLDNVDEFVIGCPANLVEKKGHQYLIAALDQLKGSMPAGKRFRCRIIGDGPLRDELQAQIETTGLTDVVVLEGRLPHNHLLAAYGKRLIDVVVIPSIVTKDSEREGIPVALMEAMSYAIPVISTATGGTEELLRDGAGILVPAGNAQPLSDAMAGLFANPHDFLSIGLRGRERVIEEFNVERVVCQLCELIRK